MLRLRSGERASLLREPLVGSVIPDVVFGIWTGELPRWGPLNSVSRHILAWLLVKKVAGSEESLCADLFLSRHAAASGVSALQRIGAVATRDSGEIELRPDFRFSESIRLVAVEMKLRRWKEALSQAAEYRRFADESYVVMDGNQVQVSDESRAEFTRNGVGLILQSMDEIRFEIPAELTVPPPSVDRLFLWEKLARTGPHCLA